jgi:2,4-dienoyl-CoA reductase-like NADH-dependent reductase (Old Yellow Enzyme family)
MSNLFKPLKIRNVALKNRIAVSPMCQYSSVDGFASDWHLVHLGSRAVGGAALVIQEATAVSPEARITPDDLGIYMDQHLDMLGRITHFIREQGAVPGIQLAHAGRKASHLSPWKGGHQIAPEQTGGWQTLSASSIPFSDQENPPLQLDQTGIQKVVDDFRQAARRAVDAGYRVIEIHAAHGYLLHQFLSPLSNTRSDQYGGSLENRARLLIQVVDALRSDLTDGFPLMVRLSCTDWMESGWDIDQSVTVSSLLKSRGVDLIDCSSGGTSTKQIIPLGPGYQVPFAERIREKANILTGAVGLIVSPTQAEEILERKQADLILLAREFLRDPYFPLHAAHALHEQVDWPVQYERAKPKH